MHKLFYLNVAIFLCARAEDVAIRYARVTLDPIASEIAHGKSFQRLRDIAQYGLRPDAQPYSRYEHSIGVYYILQRYGAPLYEQLAGELHDASHTVYSHTGDYLFATQAKRYEKDSYQDDHHLEWLAGTEIPAILAAHGISLDDINHKNSAFTMLEQDLPDMCADRIEYNIVAGLLEELITLDDVEPIFEHLHFDTENNLWYFDDLVQARKLADISVYNTRYVWTSPESIANNRTCAKLLKRALELQIITFDDVHYSTDSVVLDRLRSCNDAQINELLHEIYHPQEASLDSRGPVKCRAIDPLILTHAGYQRLSTLDLDYAQVLQELRAWCC